MDHKIVDGVKYPLSDAEIAAKKAHEAEWEAEAPARQAKKDRVTGLQGEPAVQQLAHRIANDTSQQIDDYFASNVTTPAQAIDVLKTVVKVLALKL